MDENQEAQVQAQEESQLQELEELLSTERPAVDLGVHVDPQEAEEAEKSLSGEDLLKEFDANHGLRMALQDMAKSRGHWSGIPMPINELELVLEPKYPYAEKFIKQGLAHSSERNEQILLDEGIKVRNDFWSHRYRVRVIVYEVDGKVYAKPVPGTSNVVTPLLDTMMASEAWGVEQESRALQLLATLLPFHMFKKYLLTGTFIETSKRSGTIYMFRRLRPTVAISKNKNEETLSILCAMCMHPIGYYHGTWGGVMCPTDDVIAHLMMMRGDERKFWAMCNQHPPHHPLAGI